VLFGLGCNECWMVGLLFSVDGFYWLIISNKSAQNALKRHVCRLHDIQFWSILLWHSI